jgi:Xaa-Pro aminopeptidase
MNTRIAAVQRALKGSSYLFTAAADLFYLTGISLDGFWLVVAPRGATAITSQMTADHLRSLLPGIPVVVASSFSDGCYSVCKSQRIRTLGLDPESTSVAVFDKLKAKISLVSSGSPLTTTKLYKYKPEIAAIREACRIAVKAYRYARTQCKPGGLSLFTQKIRLRPHFRLSWLLARTRPIRIMCRARGNCVKMIRFCWTWAVWCAVTVPT